MDGKKFTIAVAGIITTSATTLPAGLIPTGSIAMDILIIYAAAKLVRAITAPIMEQCS